MLALTVDPRASGSAVKITQNQPFSGGVAQVQDQLTLRGGHWEGEDQSPVRSAYSIYYLVNMV